MSDETLQAQPSATETAPAAEVKAEQGEIKAAEETAEGDAPKKDEPKLSEAERTRQQMQKRIDRVTAASKANEERARQLEQQIAELSAKAPKAEQGEPKQDDYDTFEEWQEAVIDHRAKVKADGTLKAEKEKELKATQERQHAETRRQFTEKENTFRTANPDYDRYAGEAVEAIQALGAQGTNIAPLRDVVMQFDNPPEMLYQLGKDTSLLETLVTMPPLQIMRELVKLESALHGSKQEIQDAPDPIKPVGGKGGGKSLSERSGSEILEWVKRR